MPTINTKSINNFTINRYCDDNNKVYVELLWNDPEDTLWQNTTLVRNDTHFPENETDGTVIITNTEKNKYSTTALVDEDPLLIKEKDYFYSLFPLIDNVYISDKDNERIAINYTNPPDDVLNFDIIAEEQDIKITWEDPANFNWEGTVLVRKLESEPISIEDGTIICINKLYNQYKTNYFVDKAVSNYKNYYYKLFPYNNNKIYNNNCESKLATLKDNITPNPVSGLILTMDKDINNVSICKLIWTDPDDVDWKSTTVVKKIDSYPSDVNDGTLVTISTIKNRYQTNALIDNYDANNNYYYKLFPCDLAGNYDLSDDNNVTLFDTINIDLSRLYDFNNNLWWQWSSDNSYLFCENNVISQQLKLYETFITTSDSYLSFEYMFKGGKNGSLEVYDNEQLIFSDNVPDNNWKTGYTTLLNTSHNIVFESHKSTQWLDPTQQLSLRNIVIFYKK